MQTKRGRGQDALNGSLPASRTTLVPSEPPAPKVTKAETSTSLAVLEARSEMREEMGQRLSSMLASLRTGLRAEMAEASGDLRDATLDDLASRFEAINKALEPDKLSPFLKLSLRSRLRELTGVAVGIFVQMLKEEGRKEELEELTTEAKEMARAAVETFVPNMGKLD